MYWEYYVVDVLYWVGCTTSHIVPRISEKMISILTKVGVDFRVLGSRERCCGYPLIILGDYDGFKALAKDVVDIIYNEGVSQVVTNCPGCYRCFNEFYPKALGVERLPFKVIHSTQFVYENIRLGRLRFKDSVKLRVTYHDPCDLGRHSGVYDIPRNILTSIPNIEFVEMERSREAARCCGAGGVLRILIPQLSTQVSITRIKDDVTPLNVDAVITACPTCVKNLRDGASISEIFYNLKHIDILDIIELIDELTL